MVKPAVTQGHPAPSRAKALLVQVPVKTMDSLIKAWCLNHVPKGLLAPLHGLRFAWLLHRRPQDPETALLGNLLQPGGVAVDVGANGANWTWFLSQAVGPGGYVFAFEADPYYARATAAAVRAMHLTNVTLFPFGLSDRSESVTLRTQDLTGAPLGGCSHVDRGAAPGTGAVRVRLEPLDDLVAQHPALTRTALLKCDVEGYELPVLRGAEAILRQARPTLVFEAGHGETQGFAATDIGDWLNGHDYTLYALDRLGRLVPVPPDLSHPDAATVNRIALPRERLHALSDRLPFAGQTR